ncbi:MAG: Nramp family divalent metal transporter [Bryobacteraceae bacterium]|nr:Nramp family divalent metal transporter [Bryobacteraceae bacterium]
MVNEKSGTPAASPSLPEVHSSVPTVHTSNWKRMFAFAGPAYLVSVGYMDPGNWATDLEGGARFGYDLLWVLVMSNLMAILLQTLSARLGIVTGRDLAQACRETYPRAVSGALWFLCEIAIAACDLAEVLGAAIGLNLLFGIPLLAGVLLTSLDTLLLLWFSQFGVRAIEGFVLVLISVIGVCFAAEIFLAKPSLVEIANGLIPRLTDQSLYVAIGILGATVMPHNLYLHSALVQTRRIGSSVEEKRTACRFNLIDSVVALNGALFVNAAILIVAATVFFKRGIVVNEIQQAHLLLAPLLGTAAASVMFAVALLCAGQSSTLTGTMAGQIVMEGFLNFRMRPWLRRLITRLVAIAPAVATILIVGESGTWRLLILSQVILSMQLPFAVIPLIHFTSDNSRMGSFANRMWVNVLAWSAAVVIVGLNFRLVYSTVSQWLDSAGAWRTLILSLLIPILFALVVLLLWVTLEPWLPGVLQRRGRRPSVVLPSGVAADLSVIPYRHVLVPLDHTDRDRLALAHAAALARTYGARLTVMHVEEGVTSQVYGDLALTAEVEAGHVYLSGICEALRAAGIDVQTVITHSDRPASAIIKVARDIKPDLVIMGAHGHSGVMDLIFGTTINSVRHSLRIPVLIVRDPQ